MAAKTKRSAPQAAPPPAVGIIMGSQSDWPTMRHAGELLDQLGVGYEARIVSAHRTPDRLYEYAGTARERGLKVIIAGAGGAAHLPGMAAAMTSLPVLGVPVQSAALSGQDSLLSIVQMPAGVAVGTLAIGVPGAKNAALLASQILALSDAALARRIDDLRKNQTASVAEEPSREKNGGDLMETTTSALKVGATIGILGGGQLGRMLAMAAAQLGFRIHVFCQDADEPACQVANAVTLAPFGDLDALQRFAKGVDVITYEFENIPLDSIVAVDAVAPLAPGPRAIEIAQDRVTEKNFIADLGIPVAPFVPVSDDADLATAVNTVQLPAILKSRRLGYDGKGQIRLSAEADLNGARGAIGDVPAVLEGFISFNCELSAIVARSADGAIVSYDPGENVHKRGILDTTTVPARVLAETKRSSIEFASRIAVALDYIDVLAVEFFYCGEDSDTPLIVNEIAPRVHNSGHWTIDACACSQFENHIRAVAGWPLGATARHSDAVMTNLIGSDIDDAPRHLTVQGASLHLYGKRETRPGRKMGHVTKIMRAG